MTKMLRVPHPLRFSKGAGFCRDSPGTIEEFLENLHLCESGKGAAPTGHFRNLCILGYASLVVAVVAAVIPAALSSAVLFVRRAPFALVLPLAR